MNTPRSRNYTLIELIVVIAIIMILAALIVPALRSAKESAKKTQCLANQKNIGQYVHLFAQNNNNSLKVMSNWSTWYRDMIQANGGFKNTDSIPNNHYLSFKDSKGNYVTITKAKSESDMANSPLNGVGLGMAKVFVCPSDANFKEGSLASYGRNDPKQGGTVKYKDGSTGARADALASYGRNDPKQGGTMKYKEGSTGARADALANPRMVDSRLNDIRAPSDLILAADHWGKTHRPGESENSEEYEDNNIYHLRLREGDTSIGDLGGKRDDVSRHRGSPPIVYVDGHITATDWKATIPKRFHNDTKRYEDGLGWQGRAVGSWSDDPCVKK